MDRLIVLAVLVAAPATAQTPPLETVRVVSGLALPSALTAPSGDANRLFVCEQKTGRITIIENGLVLTAPFLDLGSRISTAGNEQGLLDLAFHPDYASNGRFFVNYTSLATGATVIEGFTAPSPAANTASLATGSIVFSTNEPFPNHNGSHIAFGIDGYLYIGLGDGGSTGDPGCRAQDGASFHGKLLRIDVDAGSPYAIPPSNPFVGTAGFHDEIWALGLRNPWRFSFDRSNGDLYIGDVGQSSREEVDWRPGTSTGGENYGWKIMEGLSCFSSANCIASTPPCDDPAFQAPIHQYPHGGGKCAIIGGYVYRGPSLPELHGHYFFADFCTAQIWSFRWDGVTLHDLLEHTQELSPSEGGYDVDSIISFGEDGSGELHLVTRHGEVFKITRAHEAGRTYCTGKTNSLGCVPFLTLTGTPSVSSTSSYRITGNDMIAGEAGLLLYSFTKANLAFHGGKLCVKPPFVRLLPAKVAAAPGAPPCTGELGRDFNATIRLGADPLLTAGQTVCAQWRQREPADPAGFGDGLTDGLRFTVFP